MSESSNQVKDIKVIKELTEDDIQFLLAHTSLNLFYLLEFVHIKNANKSFLIN